MPSVLRYGTYYSATDRPTIQTVGLKSLRSRIALETGMHSPWVSRVLISLGHETIVVLTFGKDEENPSCTPDGKWVV
jgi:hypothetical protein